MTTKKPHAPVLDSMSYAAALAKQHRAHIVTGDREFWSLGAEVNKVWL